MAPFVSSDGRGPFFRYVSKKTKRRRGPTVAIAQRIAVYDAMLDAWEQQLTPDNDELRRDIDDLRAYRATLTNLEPLQPIWLRRLDRRPKVFQPREPSRESG